MKHGMNENNSKLLKEFHHIADGLYPSYSNTLMWLSKMERLYKSVKVGEEDIIHAGLVYSTGEVDDNYIQLYASFLQDEEKSRTQFLFHMRDIGVCFDGLDDAREEFNVLKSEFSEYKKERNEKIWNDKAAVAPIEYDEYFPLTRKQKKTKEESYKVEKI